MKAPPSDEILDHLDLAERALEGDPEALAELMEMLRAPGLTAALISRGATPTEANDIITDLAGDCFGGERKKGGLHRLLARYAGGCPLPAYLRHIALNRLISLKRAQSLRPEATSANSDDEDDLIDRLPGEPSVGGDRDDALIHLLQGAVVEAFAQADPEKMALFRLVHSYKVPQKRAGQLWGWSETKVSRAFLSLRDDLQKAILAALHKADPWLELDWEDFIALCGGSIDLFAQKPEDSQESESDASI